MGIHVAFFARRRQRCRKQVGEYSLLAFRGQLDWPEPAFELDFQQDPLTIRLFRQARFEATDQDGQRKTCRRDHDVLGQLLGFYGAPVDAMDNAACHQNGRTRNGWAMKFGSSRMGS